MLEIAELGVKIMIVSFVLLELENLSFELGNDEVLLVRLHLSWGEVLAKIREARSEAYSIVGRHLL